ncbi:aspartate kinase, partial [Caldithrix abyssi]|nr:aspartate kinase [Caldithrix abyssi]
MLLRVLKFGGTSIASADRIRRVGTIIRQKRNENGNLAVIVSALGGVTNKLIALAESAAKNQNIDPLFQDLVGHHFLIIEELFPENEKDIRCRVEAYFNELKSDISYILEEKHLSSQSLDKFLSYGELLSTTIIANYLSQNGIPAEQLDACQVVLTDDHFGHAYVHYKKSYNRIRAYYKNRDKLQIITGFLGATESGKITTLGRSGSDYSASIFGAALNASTIEIWTDVDGILSADPTIVKNAKTIPRLTYEEAMELAHAGARVIFPPTMIPAKYKQIPIIIKNTFNPDHPGSLITQSRKINGEKTVGISSVSDISLLRLQGAGMVSIFGINSRIFSALTKEKISVLLVSQAFSEHATCFALNPLLVQKAIKALEKEFAIEMKNHYIDRIRIEENLSMVAVVGEGMRHTPGISGTVFGTLGDQEVNIIAIAQGSSERNISFIVEDRDVDRAIISLHHEFFDESKSGVDLFLVGVGTVGSELLSILGESKQEQICVKGVACSHTMLLSDHALDPDEVVNLLKQSSSAFDLNEFLNGTPTYRRKKVFVDCTASASLSKQYPLIFEKGFSIVTANKIANTLDYKFYQSLREKTLE